VPAPKLNRSVSGPKTNVVALPRRPDAVGEMRFKVDLPGIQIGRFREVTGLGVEVEVKEYMEGGVNDFVHKLPTRFKYQNIVLKRGVTFEVGLLRWLERTRRDTQRVDMTITLMGPGTKTVASWAFAEAFPVKWTGPNLNAGSNQIATETLEVAHAGMKIP
jgi:phage tail-like protein